ncbi:hypothetical protein ACJ41O_001771 [Fusarium nematophilum]
MASALAPAPPLGPLRIASPGDILRLGIVAASGFRYSPVFDWERPYHAKFPQDTLLSYRHEFSSAIKHPECIVLVATDRFDPNEGEKSTAIIPPDNGWHAPKAGDEVVVGVACWRLEPGSSRNGSFQNDNAYWKHEHGSGLAQWGIDLAKLDKVRQGLMAAKMDKPLYSSLGFENLEDLHIDGDDIMPQGVDVSVMRYYL